MDRVALDKAGKDVKAIKDMMARTTEDFLQLGKIFVGWGLAFLVLFLGVMAAYAFRGELSETIVSFPTVTVIPLILTAAAASVSYYIIKKMRGLGGLTKPLLAVWLAIITYVTVFPALEYIVTMDRTVKDYRGYYTHNYNVFVRSTLDSFFHSYMDIGSLLFMFIFGLLCLRLFTRLKFTGVLAFIYTLLFVARDVVLVLINRSDDIRSVDAFFAVYNTSSIICYSVIVPATFLIIGGYLEFCRVRRS